MATVEQEEKAQTVATKNVTAIHLDTSLQIERCKAEVTALLTEAGIAFAIVGSGEVWKDFRGGASVANQSHFYVEIKLVTVPPMQEVVNG